MISKEGTHEPPPGPLIASGRAADVYDLSDGTVLRRYRSDHDVAPEARLMDWLAAAGIAVPAVHRAERRDLVMEYVPGPTMLDDLQRKPWRLWHHTKTLAALQRSINSVAAPDWAPTHEAAAAGDVIVHGDLHPMNVILGPAGPVVIDLTNAGRGSAAFDAALSYVLMSTFETSGVTDRVGQRLLVRVFQRARGAELIDAGLDAACGYRLADPNVTAGERRRVEHLRTTSSTRHGRAA